MMNDFFYNKTIAAFALVAMVLFSVFVLGGSGLRQEREKALDVFYGDNEYGVDISLECENIISNCKNLLVIAGKYLEKDDEAVEGLSIHTSYPVSVDRFERANGLSGSSGFAQKYANDVMVKLLTMDITEKDREYLIKIEADIDTAVRKSLLSGYNICHESYAVTISNPYTGFIAKVTGNGIENLPAHFLR